MRLPKDAVEELRAAIAPFDTPEMRGRYRSGDFHRSECVKDHDKRYRWDLLAMSGFQVWTLYDLYEVNDAHIDSALRSIVPSLHDTVGVA